MQDTAAPTTNNYRGTDSQSKSNSNTVTTSQTMDDLAKIISNSSKIIVVCGAGISVSSGIPDFRSPSSGIYNLIASLPEYGSLPQPECLFSLDFFVDNPTPFWKFAPTLYSNDTHFQPSPTHYFFTELDRRDKLLRVYTQNIDGLEFDAGLPPSSPATTSKVVQCHGSMRKVTCMDCKRTFNAPDDIQSSLSSSEVPRCGETGIVARGDLVPPSSSCNGSSETTSDRPLKKRRRSSRSATVTATESSESKMTRGCPGVLKPNVTFFGEKVTSSVMELMQKDATKADLVLVVGTSLQVRPLSTSLSLFQACSDGGPMVVLVNKDSIDMKKTGSKRAFDAEYLGECDGVFEAVCELLEWETKKVVGVDVLSGKK